MALIEAMAAGRPVVATRVGDIPALVEDGVTGFLVPPGDDDTLAGVIALLLRDDALRRRLGDAGRATVAARWSVERMVEALQRIYEHAISARRRRDALNHLDARDEHR